MIRDNRKLEEWPEVTIITTELFSSNSLDDLPFAQKLNLSCGHYCINTFGARGHEAYSAGDKLRCRTCGVK